MKRNHKISVTIITGFLGAGKTTFINSTLKSNPEKQFALVENEFGEVSIDTKLIKGVDASQMFELKQGCICCTISDEYELVLQELAERFPNIEHLLIETTGIADPAFVIRPFFKDLELRKSFEYKGTVCLADALNFENSPEKEITIKQLVIADLILISKTEKLSNEEKLNIETKLQKINSFAKIEFLNLDSNKNIQIDSILYHKKSDFNFVQFSESHSAISTKKIEFDSPLVKIEFLRWLEYTLDIYKKKIYRTKGVLCFQNEPFEYILQGVGGNFEIIESDLILGKTKTEIVFIGRLKDLELNFHP